MAVKRLVNALAYPHYVFFNKYSFYICQCQSVKGAQVLLYPGEQGFQSSYMGKERILYPWECFFFISLLALY